MFKDTLRIMLKDSGMTQVKLAEASQMTPSAISQFISGAREPTLKSLLQICTALRTTPNDMLGFHSGKRFALQKEINRLQNQLSDIKRIVN